MTIRVGIVGLGDGGRGNSAVLLTIPGLKIIAVCDSNEQILANTQGFGYVARYAHVTTMASNPAVDLVIVATEDDQLLGNVWLMLSAGKHVFVEKPVATSEEDLSIFAKLAKQYPSHLHFGEKYTFAYPIQALIKKRNQLGPLMNGSTSYRMWDCDRIMGDGKWRTESRYNPCAGGLSHNFMTIVHLVQTPIVRIMARGKVETYAELMTYGGFDTMQGILELEGGALINFEVCLSVQGKHAPYAYRTVSHLLQFEHGSLMYGPKPENDRLVFGDEGEVIPFTPEPALDGWPEYNRYLYRRMLTEVVVAVNNGTPATHTINEGINIAAACLAAFDSAHSDGKWIDLNPQFTVL